jgi:hypothetical protein
MLVPARVVVAAVSVEDSAAMLLLLSFCDSAGVSSVVSPLAPRYFSE